MLRLIHPMTRTFLVALMLLALFMTSGCSKKTDLSGNWKGKITLPDTGKSLSELEFSLNQKGQEITGTMLFTKPGAKLPLTGTASKGNISLSSPMKNGLAVTISGILENKKTIRGTAVLDYDTPQLGKRQDRALLELTR